MSGRVRTLEKRILKRKGFSRQTHAVEVVAGTPRVIRLKKGEGDIINPAGDKIGKRWPRATAQAVSA